MDSQTNNESEQKDSEQPTVISSESVYPTPTKGVAADAPIVGSQLAEKMAENTLDTAVATSDLPVPVVKVLSVKGVEYFMMTFSLWTVATGLIWSLIAIVNSITSFAVLAFPVSLLLVGLPIFAAFYLRLRKAELLNPELRLDASKRRLSQITQILAFLACITNTIGFVYILLSKVGGTETISLGKAFLNLLVVLVVAGGILVYYWFDEHRIKRV